MLPLSISTRPRFDEEAEESQSIYAGDDVQDVGKVMACNSDSPSLAIDVCLLGVAFLLCVLLLGRSRPVFLMVGACSETGLERQVQMHLSRRIDMS